MTRLTDLEPHWIQPSQWSEQSPPFYIGVSFLHPDLVRGPCPTCGAPRDRRLAVKFWPPIDPTGVEAKITPIPHDGFHTRVSGNDFASLTISPSIGLDPIWHGNITDGEVVTV